MNQAGRFQRDPVLKGKDFKVAQTADPGKKWLSDHTVHKPDLVNSCADGSVSWASRRGQSLSVHSCADRRVVGGVVIVAMAFPEERAFLPRLGIVFRSSCCE